VAIDPFDIDVRGQRRAVFRLVIVAGVILVMSMAGKKSRERAEAAQLVAPAPAHLETSPVQSRVTPEAREPHTFAPGARTPVPRPLPTRTSVAPPLAPAPTDTGAEDLQLREALHATLEEVVPDVRDCLQMWWMLDPALSGAVEVEFALTEQGLGEVEILDHSDVPVGPLSCFATALYGVDWPRTQKEVTVVQPFRFENG